MILAILQARMSSTRFPGKVLAALLGEPMIVRQIERLKRSEMIDHLVVATSQDASDNSLVQELVARGVDVRRGPLDDVVQRFDSVVAEYSPSTIVRLTADCPLADPIIVDDVIRAHLEVGADFSSNTIHPTYPDGLDAECVSAAAWSHLTTLSLSPREREHVTLRFHGRDHRFSVNSVTQPTNRSNLRWTVDLVEDLEFVREIYRWLYDLNPGFGQEEIVALLASYPELNRTSDSLARNAGLNESSKGREE